MAEKNPIVTIEMNARRCTAWAGTFPSGRECRSRKWERRTERYGQTG